MRSEIQSVSGAISRDGKPGWSNFRHQVPDDAVEEEGKHLHRVKFAWLAASQSARASNSKGKLGVFLEQLKFYCDNSSLAGYKYITEIRRTWFERYIERNLFLTDLYLVSEASLSTDEIMLNGMVCSRQAY